MTSPLASPSEPIYSAFADDSDFRALLQEFAAALPKRRDGLQAAYRAGAFDELRSRAHQLKGAGGGFGFPQLSELAAELELASQAQDAAGLAERLESIIGYMNRITI